MDCYDKAIEYMDDDRDMRVLHGKKKPTLMRMLTTR